MQGAERREAQVIRAKEKAEGNVEELEKDRGSMESELRACRDTLAQLQKECKEMDRDLRSSQRNASSDTQKQSQVPPELLLSDNSIRLAIRGW